MLKKQDGKAISFLAGGTADAPGSDCIAYLLALEQFRNNLFREGLPSFAIAKKVRDTDQDIVEHGGCFWDVQAHVTQIGFERCEAVQLHAAFDAAQNGGAFILAEIVSRARLHLCQNALDSFSFLSAKFLRI